MPPMYAKELRVYPLGGRHFVFSPQGRGENLQRYLEAHGITSALSRVPGVVSDRLELLGEVDAAAAQALIDRWPRRGAVGASASAG